MHHPGVFFMSAPLLPGEAAAGAYPISAVERETGLSKDTLRMWERRYGFPGLGAMHRGNACIRPSRWRACGSCAV
jgi:hypothetical protein